MADTFVVVRFKDGDPEEATPFNCEERALNYMNAVMGEEIDNGTILGPDDTSYVLFKRVVTSAKVVNTIVEY